MVSASIASLGLELQREGPGETHMLEHADTKFTW